MKLMPHQVQGSEAIRTKLLSKGLAIVHAPERSGKTLMTIDAIARLPHKKVLVITKKRAIDGWLDDIRLYSKEMDRLHRYIEVINYERLHKVSFIPELIVIDEFHYAISSFPKTPAKAKIIRDRWLTLPKILISATPAAESASQWFHPLWLCDSHPFSGFKNFYEWAQIYVNITEREIGDRTIKDYSNAKDECIMQEVTPYLIQIKPEETGIRFRPNVIASYVELEPRTLRLIDHLKRFGKLGKTFVADTPIKMVNGIYQLECGSIKVNGQYYDMGNREHVQWIKERFGDSDQVAIMTRWIGERMNMQKEFKKALVLSSHAHAEGVELSHIEHLIISSLDYSTARFQQRNARQASIKRKSPINVHVLISKDQVNEEVYKAVALKHQDFQARLYMRKIKKRQW